MTRLVIVLPLEPLRVGDRFTVTEWPLHITALAPFLPDVRGSALTDAIGSVAGTVKPFSVRAGRVELFGRHRSIPVRLIEPSLPLTALHESLVETLRPLAFAPDEPAFTSGQFTPHVTSKGTREVPSDAVLALTQLALVDMAPRSHPAGRAVLATWSFT